MAATLPTSPITLLYVSSTSSSITFEWTEPLNDGGTPVYDYKIYWNGGVDNDPFVLLSDSSLGLTSFTK